MNDTNYNVIQEPGAAPIKLWTRGVPLEDEAREQLKNIARLPFIHQWVAVMPDVHLGKGAQANALAQVVQVSQVVNPAHVHGAQHELLLDHAHEFGFIIRYKADWTDITGYADEPWHIRYVGRDHAGRIHELDIPLELYIEQLRLAHFGEYITEDSLR